MATGPLEPNETLACAHEMAPGLAIRRLEPVSLFPGILIWDGADARLLGSSRSPTNRSWVARSMIAGHAASPTTSPLCSRKARNPSQKMTARPRRAPDTLTRRPERIAGIHGLSIDTIEL